jgi:excisionase family DNA binding protein
MANSLILGNQATMATDRLLPLPRCQRSGMQERRIIMDTKGDIYEVIQLEERLLRVEDIANYLNTSKSYAYRLVQSGVLRSIKIGRCVRIHPRDLQVYVEQNLHRQVNN